MEVNPLSIILVKSDSKGDRLLFRYPFRASESYEPLGTRKRNPYAIVNNEDLLQSPPPPISNICKGNFLTGFPDEVLSTLFAVKPELCNRKFELKVNDVRFVGHPTLLPVDRSSQDGLLIHIVFALRALASHSIVKCYYELSKLLGTALRHEERRCSYVSQQNRLMAGTHDEANSNSPEASFDLILTKSSLAKNLKSVYEDLSNTGLVKTRINEWIPLNFCLPQKVHQWHWRNKIVEPQDINMCLNSVRPYHGLLLLTPVNQLIDSLSLDGSPTLVRLLKMYSPVKSLQTLAADADLTLSHVYELSGHLLYWAEATIIYPLCASNKYVIAKDAPVHINSLLTEKFNEIFPDKNLIEVISEFSLPTSLSHKTSPFTQQSQLVQMMVWMLQHHLLSQLHTYIQFMCCDEGGSNDNNSNKPTCNGNEPHTKQKRVSISDVIDKREIPNRTESESGNSTMSDDVTLEPSNVSAIGAHSLENDNSFTSIEEHKSIFHHEQLLDFSEYERQAILKIPASDNPEDLSLLAKLCRKGYFCGEHHLEEIMYLENLRRSQLLQLLDKFRDVLVTYETEDPAITMNAI